MARNFNNLTLSTLCKFVVLKEKRSCGSEVVLKTFILRWCQFGNNQIDGYYYNFNVDISLFKQLIPLSHAKNGEKMFNGKSSNDFHP